MSGWRMIFSRTIHPFALLVTALVLVGCPGLEDNGSESGVRVRFAEVHVEDKPTVLGKVSGVTVLPVATSKVQDSANSLSASAVAIELGGYAHSALERHDITDSSGQVLSMYRMFLVVDQVELVQCVSIAHLPARLLSIFIPTASAHTGHGAEPVGGRSLGEANVINLVTRDEYYLALGDLAVAPGRYCSARVALGFAQDNAHGKVEAAVASTDNPVTSPEVPDLKGKMFALRADYCSTIDAGVCAGRTRVDIDDVGLTLPTIQTLEFATPLELSESKRTAFVAIGIAYGAWAHDVNVSLLVSDINERQKFLNNIASSLHVYSKGLGGLPSNTSFE